MFPGSSFPSQPRGASHARILPQILWDAGWEVSPPRKGGRFPSRLDQWVTCGVPESGPPTAGARGLRVCPGTGDPPPCWLG